MRSLLSFLAASSCALAAEYHVSPRGSDADTGLSPSHAWRTLERVNRHVREHGLGPGDSVRLAAGGKFRGPLVIEHAGGGEPSRPVLVAAADGGRATIEAGLGDGVRLRETPWVVVSNLDLVAGKGNRGDGIRCDRDREAASRTAGVAVAGCTARGFGWHGIMIDAAQHAMGLEDVRVERCVATGNRHAGIMVYGGNQAGRTVRPHARVAIEDCVARDNPGDPDELRHHSGTGILLDGVDGGRVRGCVASGNGALCRSDRGGPVGIWTHASRGVVIEGCESYGNRSALHDGGGFDLDAGSEDCVLRGNFSHDNQGPGFLVCSYAGAAYADRGCRVEGNVSLRDGAAGTGYAGIQVGAEPGCRVRDLEVTRNTVVAPERSFAGIRVTGHGISAVVRGNLVLAPAHGVLVAVQGFEHALRFEHNRYWRRDGKPAFLVDAQWVVPSLSAWRRPDGPERRFTAGDELFADPRLEGLQSFPARAAAPRPRWPEHWHDAGGTAGAPFLPPPGTRLSR